MLDDGAFTEFCHAPLTVVEYVTSPIGRLSHSYRWAGTAPIFIYSDKAIVGHDEQFVRFLSPVVKNVEDAIAAQVKVAGLLQPDLVPGRSSVSLPANVDSPESPPDIKATVIIQLPDSQEMALRRKTVAGSTSFQANDTNFYLLAIGEPRPFRDFYLF
jgi:hypothetical protein